MIFILHIHIDLVLIWFVIQFCTLCNYSYMSIFSLQFYIFIHILSSAIVEDVFAIKFELDIERNRFIFIRTFKKHNIIKKILIMALHIHRHTHTRTHHKITSSFIESFIFVFDPTIVRWNHIYDNAKHN